MDLAKSVTLLFEFGKVLMNDVVDFVIELVHVDFSIWHVLRFDGLEFFVLKLASFELNHVACSKLVLDMLGTSKAFEDTSLH